MIPDKICFVDVETTGTSANFNRIIEIGILRVENKKLVKKFQTLINPEEYLDPYIEKITGITSAQLESAPTFSQVKDEVMEVLEGCVFAAHNVRFDYGFVKNEFRRLGLKISFKHFCTVKLARALFPGLTHYNLDSIMENFHIASKQRHRAYDDALVLWKFYKKYVLFQEEEVLIKTFKSLFKTPSLPTNLSLRDIKSLPEDPGVYIFYGDKGVPLYVGKSINIKERVLSHFSQDLNLSREMKISQQVKSIEAIQTAGELSALLKESFLIKKLQPLYNRQLRNAYQMLCLVKKVTDEGFNTIEITQLNKIDSSQIQGVLGVFRSNKQLKDFVVIVARDYQLCHKLLGLEKTKKACFEYHLGNCKGACINMEKPLFYNLRFDQAFYKYKIQNWPFPGPVLIKETGQQEAGFLIDNWCLLGEIMEDRDLEEITNNDYSFDYDTYKILVKTLQRPGRFIQIIPRKR
ncbi:GIY-YIG nuclease family protein [Candidatus Microgenomates bacterium]|nr:GIY-YIG nuclease family protein [Candidatus Microgenomates bacterium]